MSDDVAVRHVLEVLVQAEGFQESVDEVVELLLDGTHDDDADLASKALAHLRDIALLACRVLPFDLPPVALTPSQVYIIVTHAIVVALRTGDLGLGSRLLDGLCSMFPEARASGVLRGWILFCEGRATESIMHFEPLLSDDGKNRDANSGSLSSRIDVHVVYSIVCLLRGDYPTSMSHCQKAATCAAQMMDDPRGWVTAQGTKVSEFAAVVQRELRCRISSVTDDGSIQVSANVWSEWREAVAAFEHSADTKPLTVFVLEHGASFMWTLSDYHTAMAVSTSVTPQTLWHEYARLFHGPQHAKVVPLEWEKWLPEPPMPKPNATVSTRTTAMETHSDEPRPSTPRPATPRGGTTPRGKDREPPPPPSPGKSTRLMRRELLMRSTNTRKASTSKAHKPKTTTVPPPPPPPAVSVDQQHDETDATPLTATAPTSTLRRRNSSISGLRKDPFTSAKAPQQHFAAPEETPAMTQRRSYSGLKRRPSLVDVPKPHQRTAGGDVISAAVIACVALSLAALQRDMRHAEASLRHKFGLRRGSTLRADMITSQHQEHNDTFTMGESGIKRGSSFTATATESTTAAAAPPPPAGNARVRFVPKPPGAGDDTTPRAVSSASNRRRQSVSFEAVPHMARSRATLRSSSSSKATTQPLASRPQSAPPARRTTPVRRTSAHATPQNGHHMNDSTSVRSSTPTMGGGGGGHLDASHHSIASDDYVPVTQLWNDLRAGRTDQVPISGAHVNNKALRMAFLDPYKYA
eukprot:PhM_4_TR4176/c0_g1_i1/m.78439